MKPKYVLNFRYKGAIVEEYSHGLRESIFASALEEATAWIKDPDHIPGNWDQYSVDEA